MKRHYGLMPDWLAWLFCKRTVCSQYRNKILNGEIKID